MVKFREKKNGRIWDISNEEHLKHFRSNPRFEELKNNENIKNKNIKKENKNIKSNNKKIENIEKEEK